MFQNHIHAFYSFILTNVKQNFASSGT